MRVLPSLAILLLTLAPALADERAQRVEALITTLTSESPVDARWGALVEAGGMPRELEQRESLIAAVRLHLGSGTPALRQQAARALGLLGDDGSLDRLRELARADSGADRAAAASALGYLGELAVGEAPLLARLLADEQAPVRLAAARSLGRVGATEVGRAKLSAARTHPDVALRAAVAGALARQGEGAAGLLAPMLADSEPAVRRAAVAGLSQLEGERANEALARAVWDDQLAVRLAAARALVLRGQPSGLWPLVELLSAEAVDSRRAADRALRALTGAEIPFDAEGSAEVRAEAIARWRAWITKRLGERPGAQLGVLLAGLSAGDARAREAAGRQLVELRDPRLAAQLGDAFDRSEDAQARTWLLRALIGCGGEGLSARCKVALASEAAPLRLLAAQALRQQPEAGAIEPLTRALADDEVSVRAAAAAALAQALRRVEDEDERAAPALAALSKLAHRDTERSGRAAGLAALLELPPLRALPRLVQALADPVADHRLLAARALGSGGEDDFAPALATVLADPDVRVRRAAASGLRLLASEEELPALLAARADSDARVRADVLGALTRFTSPRVTSALQAGVRDEDPSVRLAAARGLTQRKALGSGELLASLLRDPEPAVRAAAASGLAAVGGPAVIPALQRAAADESDELALLAISAIGAIGGPRARAALGEAAASLEHPRRLVEVLDQLTRMGAVEARQAACKIGAREPQALRLAALRALTRVGLDEDAGALVRRALQAEDQEIRHAALQACRAHAPRELEAALVAMLRKERDPGSFRRVAWALAAYRSPRATRALVGALASTSEGVLARLALLTAIGRTRDPEGLEALQRAASDRAALPGLRDAAMTAISRLATPRAAAFLRGQLSGPAGSDREQAVRLLGQLRDGESAARLEQLARDAALAERERQTAILALGELGGALEEETTTELRRLLVPGGPFAIHAAWALAACDPAEAAGRLSALGADPRSGAALRKQLSGPLAICAGEAAEGGLLRLLADEDQAVREQALLALARRPASERSLAAVRERLLAPAERERALATWAFGQLATESEDAASVRLALRDEAAVVRALAASTLASRGEEPPTAELLAALRLTAFPFAAQASARRLAKRSASEVLIPLLATLEVEDDVLAASAARSLGQLADSRAVGPLAGRLTAGSALLEAAAADALLTLAPDHPCRPRAETTLRRTLPGLLAAAGSPDPARRALACDLLSRRVDGPSLRATDEIATRRTALATWRRWWRTHHDDLHWHDGQLTAVD